MKIQAKVKAENLEAWVRQGLMAQTGERFEIDIEGELPYMTSLEGGYSPQARDGMVRKFMSDYAKIIENSIIKVFGPQRKAENIVNELGAGFSLGALEVTRKIAWRTPVDTGRAQGSWLVRLCDPTNIKVLARLYAIQAIVSTGGRYRIFEEVSASQQAGLRRTGAGQGARTARSKLLKAQGRRA